MGSSLLLKKLLHFLLFCFDLVLKFIDFSNSISVAISRTTISASASSFLIFSAEFNAANERKFNFTGLLSSCFQNALRESCNMTITYEAIFYIKTILLSFSLTGLLSRQTVVERLISLSAIEITSSYSSTSTTSFVLSIFELLVFTIDLIGRSSNLFLIFSKFEEYLKPDKSPSFSSSSAVSLESSSICPRLRSTA